jgi:hypothetical protein
MEENQRAGGVSVFNCSGWNFAGYQLPGTVGDAA